MLAVLDDVEEVEDAGEDELWEAAADEVFWAAEVAGEEADAATEDLEVPEEALTGEELLAGCPEVLRSWGDDTPVAEGVVESAYLQEAAAVEELRLVTVVLLLSMGDTAPGEW